MLSLYQTLSVRYLRRRWIRALLIVASIALGVTALVATQALNETMTRAGLASLNPLAGTIDLLVSNGESPVDRSLVPEVARVPGVAAALPRIFENGKLKDLDNALVLLVGVDQDAETRAESKEPGAGKLWDIAIAPEFQDLADPQRLWAEPSKLWAVLPKLWAALPKNVSLELIQEVRRKGLDALNFAVAGKELAARLPADKLVLDVTVPGQKEPARVLRVGTVEGHGPLASLSGNVLVFRDLETAARLAGFKPNQVSRIDVILRPGADRAQVKSAIHQVLAQRAEVYTPEERNQMIANAMSGMQTGFSLCGVATLVVALFLVYNALSVSVAERRHEIGILLSVGATRQQVRGLFAGEAAVLGLAGSLLGIPGGLGLAALLQPLVQVVLRDVFMTVEAQRIEVSPALVLAALVIGTLTAVAACLMPAMSAAAENPAEAVRRIPQQRTWKYRIALVTASALFIVGGVVLILVRGWLIHRLGLYGGLVLVLLGALLAMPLLADVAARLLQPLVRQLFGIEARLAADNLVRAPQRTGLVIAALASGVALFMQTAGIIRSNREALRDWVQ